jgi:hypothetical protein
MTKTVMFISWAPGEGYSITQGEPPVDLLALAEARLDRATEAVANIAMWRTDAKRNQPDSYEDATYQRLLAERRAARQDVDVLNSIGVLLESLCGP